ncbi:MAG: hypothetical protein QW797_09785 [Thermoproteota archaeon]
MKKDTMPHLLGELVRVDEAGTRGWHSSHGLKVSLGRTRRHASHHVGGSLSAPGFTIYKGPG